MFSVMPYELDLKEEEQLVARAKRGDSEAFAAIYDAFKTPLYRTVIYPRVRDEALAQDVLQDTFMLALEKISDFEWTDRSVFFWLRMIAINKSRELMSAAARHRPVDNVTLDFFPDNSYQPEKAALASDYAQELAGRIKDVLNDINERYREAIKLRLVEKKSREESAKSIGVTVETFDVVFFRACKSFRKAYIEKYGEEA